MGCFLGGGGGGFRNAYTEAIGINPTINFEVNDFGFFTPHVYIVKCSYNQISSEMELKLIVFNRGLYIRYLHPCMTILTKLTFSLDGMKSIT